MAAVAEEQRETPARDASLELVMLLLLVTGVALLSVGAWMAWEPAGLLVAGAFLVVLPVLWVRGGWAS